MATTRFTDRWLKAHRPAGREEWTDAIAPGLVARFGAGGVVFYARLRLGGRYVRERLGAFPALALVDARQAVRDLLRARERAEPVQAPGSFAALCDAYLKAYATRRKRTWAEDDRIVRADLLPVLGERRASSIRRRDVADLLDAIVERGAPVMANRVRSLLRRIFQFGIARDLVDENPAAATERPTKERAVQHDLTDAQVVAIWRALEFRHPTARNLFRLLLLTACRASEIRLATAGEFRGDLFEIPGERTKNGRAHIVPLSGLALEVLEEQRRLGLGGALLFPSPRDLGEPWALSSLSHFARNLRPLIGFTWKPKDLRTTAATIMGRLGHSAAVPRVLNHTDATVTGRYNKHDFLEEKRAALAALGAHVQTILAGP